MIIEAFKMDFGECLLIEGRKSCLLVDCGSEGSEKDLYFERVRNCLEAKRKEGKTIDAMISHFHRDHVNGFLQMNNWADCDNVFVPNIFCKKTHPNTVDYYLLQFIIERLKALKKGDNKTLPPPVIMQVLKALVDSKKGIRLFGCESYHPDLDTIGGSDYKIEGF